jgi:hypothetical protein
MSLTGVALVEEYRGSTEGIELAASEIAYNAVLGDASILRLGITYRGL